MQRMSASCFRPPVVSLVVFVCLAAISLGTLGAWAQGNREGGPTILVDLPVTTQGPLWPPADVTTPDGDFPLVGISLVSVPGFPGGFPVFGQAVLVSKDSIPPFNEDGTPSDDWFLAHHTILRPLDLSPGSPDLDLELYSLSIGPPDAFGHPRIPAEGDSMFNLFRGRHPCPAIFPTDAQRPVYSRPRFPLNEVPIWGFQGDQIDRDIITGEPFVPVLRTGPGCEEGCPGEDVVDYRRREPITLGEWVQARGTVRVTLTDYDAEAGGYTAAFFAFHLENMIPNGIYTAWTFRPRRIPGASIQPHADPLALPNVITTDSRGMGKATFKVIHPFPDPEGPDARLRIIGVVVTFHSDHQNWGACGGLLGNGAEGHNHLSSVVNGNLDITPFITVPPVD